MTVLFLQYFDPTKKGICQKLQYKNCLVAQKLKVLVVVLCYFFTSIVLSNSMILNMYLILVISECCRPSVCLSSVCLSVVGNTRAPYSGGSNFWQYFYGIWYPSHPLTSTENFTEIVPGEPLRRGS